MMEQLNRISVKCLMGRYSISERTAVRWRKRLRETGLLVGISPCDRSLVGDWSLIDRAVAVGTVRHRH